MDGKTDEDRVKELRHQLYALADRVHRLEVGVFRAVVSVGAVAIVLGYVLPFLVATTDEPDDSIALLPAAVSLREGGNGPFRDEAAMAALVTATFALVILVALVALLRLFASDVGPGPVRFARICGTVLLVLCAVAWLMILVLAGHFDGRMSAFSPATFAFTVGGVAALLAARLHPADWRGQPR
ncbi:hypothetical protein BLA60_35420 [Actinophytocola xinjiangensis]|uniref:Uncharacterized protein n=1 Tax=Actinophytocola xinjiangensis TaxID=485602 RepID=A0A7Z0WFR9_9PSEU|nr:hypothetical protein [Actinophytocola xinjiangensis]OLF05572.1 hypothetical protein BLA60_35420 [Actinophytocola xinjiangensis]